MSVAAEILDPVTNDRRGGMPHLLGLLTTAQLRESGVSAERLPALVRRGELAAISRGVYATGETLRRIRSLRSGEALLASAAALATSGPGTVASHDSAAAIHGLDLLGRQPSAVAVTRAPGEGSRTGKTGVRMHAAALPAGHVTRRSGVPVTTVARTVVDLARTLTFAAGVVAADSALRRRLTSKEELAAVLADCARWPGTCTAAAVVGFADRLSESALESVARVEFSECGLPPPELQAWLGGGADAVRVDFLWRQFRTIAEVDGAIKYTELALDPGWQAIKQLRRDSFLRELGFEVVHFTWDDIVGDRARVAAVLRAAFRRGSALQTGGAA